MTKQAQIRIQINHEPKPVEYETVWHKKRLIGVVLILASFSTLVWKLVAVNHTSHPPTTITEQSEPSSPTADVEFAKFESATAPQANLIEAPATTETPLESNELTLSEPEQAPPTVPVSITTTDAGNKVITRGLFTTAVRDKEPNDELTESIALGDAKIKRLFFYTEFTNYHNHHVVHEWFLDDKLKARVRIGVVGKKYRSYSSKYLTRSMVGNWKVVVREVGGPILQTATIKFTL